MKNAALFTLVAALAALVARLDTAPVSAQTARSPLPLMTPPTVTSPTALVGWAAGPAVAAELDAEKTMMRVPSGANAMEIEQRLSSVPHRAGSAADYATALYVKHRLQQTS